MSYWCVFRYIQSNKLGCIRHVHYTAGVNGFVPQVHYEGNCNPENYGIPSEKNGPIVTDYMAPVLDTKKESFEPYEAPPEGDPIHPHSHTIPPASSKRLSKLQKASSKIDRKNSKARKLLQEAQKDQSSHSHAQEPHSKTPKTFSHWTHTDYDYDYYDYGDYQYDERVQPTVVIIISDPVESNSSGSKPPNNFPQNLNPAAATITSSLFSQLLQKGAESHSYSAPVSVTEHHRPK